MKWNEYNPLGHQYDFIFSGTISASGTVSQYANFSDTDDALTGCGMGQTGNLECNWWVCWQELVGAVVICTQLPFRRRESNYVVVQCHKLGLPPICHLTDVGVATA